MNEDTIEEEEISVPALVLDRCWYGGRNLRPGAQIVYTGLRSRVPPYLLLRDEASGEDHNSARIAPDPQPLSAHPEPVETVEDAPPDPRSAVLDAAVAKLDRSNLELWSRNTGRPKVAAVNVVLDSAGEELTNSAELQVVQYVNTEAIR